MASTILETQGWSDADVDYSSTGVNYDGGVIVEVTIPPNFPTDPYQKATVADYSCIVRKVDICNPDGSLWKCDVPILPDGQVSVSRNRDERRSGSISIINCDNEYDWQQAKLWYDKTVKIYRGVQLGNTEIWMALIGTFVIEQVSAPHAPNVVTLTLKDRTKILKQTGLGASLEFAISTPVENVIRDLCLDAGLTTAMMNLPLTGANTSKIYTFELGSSHWQAIKEVAEAANYEVWFSADGVLQLTAFPDINNDAIFYTFETSANNSNLASFEISANDSRLRNNIVVLGVAADGTPVSATVANTEVTSNTNIATLGKRTLKHVNNLLATTAECQAAGQVLLEDHALEQFDANIEAIVIPWLEAGKIVDFISDGTSVASGSRYLLNEFTIPLTLSTMSARLQRIQKVI